MDSVEKTGFGEFVRGLRETHVPKLSLRELARRCSISAAYLSNIERELCAPPSAEIVQALAKELGVVSEVLLRKAQRITSETMQTLVNIPPQAIKIFKYFDMLISKDMQKDSIFSIRNLVAILIADSENFSFDDESFQLEVMASAASAFAQLRQCKEDPTGELARKLNRGLTVLKVIAPDLFTPSDEKELYQELLELSKAVPKAPDQIEDGKP